MKSVFRSLHWISVSWKPSWNTVVRPEMTSPLDTSIHWKPDAFPRAHLLVLLTFPGLPLALPCQVGRWAVPGLLHPEGKEWERGRGWRRRSCHRTAPHYKAREPEASQGITQAEHRWAGTAQQWIGLPPGRWESDLVLCTGSTTPHWPCLCSLNLQDTQCCDLSE